MGTAITTTPPTRVVADPADVAAPAANTAAVVTYAAVVQQAHVIAGVHFGYDGTPTGGKLTIEDGSGNTVLAIPVTAAGAGFLPFLPFKQGTANTALIITLAAGGSGVKGYVSVPAHWLAAV